MRRAVFVLGGLSLAALACSSSADVTGSSDDEITAPTRTSRPPEHDGGTQVTTGADAGDPPPDGENPPPATCETTPPNNRCGLSPQCGCAATETCEVVSDTTGAVSCIAGGNATMGRPCQQSSDCVAGLTCLYGACRPYCKTPKTNCTTAGTGTCVQHIGSDNNPVPNLDVCTVACDPRNPSAVCGPNSCVWFPDYYAPAKVTDCNFPGTRTSGQTCIDEYDCVPGYACVPDAKRGNNTYCERWCRIGVAGDCSGSTSCKDVYGTKAPVIDGQKEGVCQ